MAETNPLFANCLDTPRSWRGGSPRHRTPQGAGAVERQAAAVAEAVAEKSSALTMSGSMEALVGEAVSMTALALGEGPAKVYLFAEANQPEHITLAETWPAPWTRYVPWKVTPSEATAFSNIEAVRGGSGPRLVKLLTQYLRTVFRPKFGPSLADRIEDLSEMMREDSGGTLDLSGDSLAQLISFLERNPMLVRPSIVAGPSGELAAIWKADGKGQFSARFMPNGTVRYLLAVPNARHPQGFTRTSGDTTPDNLFSEARLGQIDWIAQV
jgi:hypothetical protein